MQKLFAAPCELLCLKKDDFDIVLKDTVLEEWDKVTAAMKRFRYFDQWDEVSRRECCIRTKIKKFEADDTVLGDGSGHEKYTYFLIKGQCVLIEHIFMKVQTRNGKKSYELLENGPEQESETNVAAKEEKVSKISKISSEKRGATSSLHDVTGERELAGRYSRIEIPLLN